MKMTDAICGKLERGICSRAISERAFLAVAALLFAASVAVTIVWCNSMSGMGGMAMAGGWTMSMAWMRMPGQSWVGAAASFVGMWIVMMAAMMLPSLVAMLLRYRRAIGGAENLGRLTALVGTGYFSVWTIWGIAAFPLGVELAALEMRHPALSSAVPIAVGVVVVIAGAFQFTAVKACQLNCCRAAPEFGALSPGAAAAWRHGLRLDCTAAIAARA